MSPNPQQVIDKLHEDHAYMIELMQRIVAVCGQRGSVASCDGCPSARISLCRSDVEHLVRSFVDVTLRHNLLESVYMSQYAPPAHRIAHNRAHLEIAEQLKLIRLKFAGDGNGVVAIEGVDRVLATLRAHLSEFDAPLEQYLLDPA